MDETRSLDDYTGYATMAEAVASQLDAEIFEGAQVAAASCVGLG